MYTTTMQDTIQNSLKYAYKSLLSKEEGRRYQQHKVSKDNLLENFCSKLPKVSGRSCGDALCAQYPDKGRISEEEFIEFFQTQVFESADGIFVERHCWDAVLAEKWSTEQARSASAVDDEVALHLWRLFVSLSGGELSMNTACSLWVTHRINSFRGRTVSSCIHARNITPSEVARGMSTFWQIVDRTAYSLGCPTQEIKQNCMQVLEDLLVEATEHIVKQGYLDKLGHVRKNWQKRWFVLLPGEIRYYTSSDKAELKGVCYITRNSRLHLVHGQCAHNHRFMITCGRTAKQFEISANSKEEKDMWLEYVSFCIEHHMTTLEHFYQKTETVHGLLSSEHEVSCNVASMAYLYQSITRNSCRYQWLKDFFLWIKLLSGIHPREDSNYCS